MKKSVFLFSILVLHISGLIAITPYHARTSWEQPQSEEWMNRQAKILNETIPQMILKKYPELTLERSGRYVSSLFLALEGYAFTSKECVYPEEAKAMLVQIHQEVLDTINQDKDLIFYLTENPRAAAVLKEQIAVRISYISFLDDFMLPPFVAQVSINKGRLFYNFNDPQTNHLKKSIAFRN